MRTKDWTVVRCIAGSAAGGGLLAAVLGGCVPTGPPLIDLDAGAETAQQSIAGDAVDAGGGMGAFGGSIGGSNGPDGPEGGPDGTPASMSGSRVEPPAMSTIEPEPIVEEMRYACQADSDCEDALVCQAEECVFVPPERAPTTILQTAGGQLLTSPGVRLQLRLGAPVPAGHTVGGGHQLTLGPLAGH